MIRRIISIDEKLCSGCGLCAEACHEGAIGMVDGKAKLLRDDHCDGLGDCLPACPTGAITFVEREAAAYDAQAVQARKVEAAKGEVGGCPSRLRQWPVQMKLVPTGAPYFENAQLLVAADCTAFAYGSFHEDFIKGRAVVVGCPKLDAVDYSEKLTAILSEHEIAGITVVRMEVPCCGGLEFAVKKAVSASGKSIDCRVVTISADGRVLSGQQGR